MYTDCTPQYRMAEFSIHKHPNYVKCVEHAVEWMKENESYYRGLMCLKNIKGGVKRKTIEESYEKLKGRIEESLEDILASRQENLCVLLVGHAGKCAHSPDAFIVNDTIRKKLSWIYSAPGDSAAYVYKNRTNRLFPVIISDEIQKKIRNKNVRLKCALALRDASTPLMLASAYIDYMTLLLHIEGIEKYINKSDVHVSELRKMAGMHMSHLKEYYGKFNRAIVDEEDFLICPVTRDRIDIADVLNNDITNERSIQLGHVVPRSENNFTIRGKNVLMMTREGNRTIGDRVFTEDVWVKRLLKIAQPHVS